MHAWVRLRDACGADAAFAFEVIERTMRPHAIATWGAWPESEARTAATADACAARSQVIESDGMQAGLLRVDVTATHVQIEQLFLLPEHQRQGIGEHVLGLVLSRARSLGLPVRLRVLRVNEAARRFYARHGFVPIGKTSERLFLECTP